MNLEKLFEWLSQFWGYIRPWAIVDQDQSGVILRLGRYSRTIGPGPHWKFPFLELDHTIDIVVTTIELRPQTLTTKDDVSIVISAIVKYQIRDVKPIMLEIRDAEDVLKDVTMGAVNNAITELDYKDIKSTDVERQVLDYVRREVNQYGFKVHKVTFADMGKIVSVRLLQSPGVDYGK